MIALFECLLSQLFLAFVSIDDFGHLHNDVEITTLNGKIEPHVVVLDKCKAIYILRSQPIDFISGDHGVSPLGILSAVDKQ